MHIELTEDEVRHFLMPRENVIESYVVEDPDTDQITDFVSFYSLPSSVLKNVKHSTLWVAYSYYYFNEKNNMHDLSKDALILAK